ncbi:uncharacterized protein METZ01_LOCUS273654, partial [marine metagenome]
KRLHDSRSCRGSDRTALPYPRAYPLGNHRPVLRRSQPSRSIQPV